VEEWSPAEVYGEKNEHMAKIPVIDAGQDDVPAALVEAWKETGFCTLVNHGVDAELVGKALAASRAFFDLPVSDKKLYGYQGHASNRGYIEQGIEHHPESSAAPDRKETFDIGKEGEEGLENMWPTELDDSTFKDVMLDYWEAMNGLYLRMMKWTAIGLGLDDAEFFVDRCDEEHCNLRLLHYPAGPAAGSRGAVHTDFGTVTLLVQDATGGLKVQLKGDGTWTHVEPLPNAIVCNVGDMLQ
jgi:isopenicillin N synthase-like dioxygenase